MLSFFGGQCLTEQWFPKLNWPWTPSITVMLPWTPCSSFDVQGKARSTEWTSENVSVDPQKCLHGLHVGNHCFRITIKLRL
ncbi:hypothetical protein T07_12137 [Trichinella nelsoni]|uniref:Uncharacterized protein n=1 Tax=Trichinella nelsoni TaxID=6336 RepID=A0A0V0RUS6_9BILA|nr:hypothetical protein T07_12137 [Trichinella nelsoni]